MKGYLLDEYPLIILPSLATAIGLNEAIALQKLHWWWLSNVEKEIYQYEGETWVKATLEEWHKNFPFWSVRTIQRIFENLEERHLVISVKPKAKEWKQQKWYRINYEVFNAESVNRFRQSVHVADDNLSESPIYNKKDNNSSSPSGSNSIPSSDFDSSLAIQKQKEEPQPRTPSLTARRATWAARLKTDGMARQVISDLFKWDCGKVDKWGKDRFTTLEDVFAVVGEMSLEQWGEFVTWYFSQQWVKDLGMTASLPKSGSKLESHLQNFLNSETTTDDASDYAYYMAKHG